MPITSAGVRQVATPVPAPVAAAPDCEGLIRLSVVVIVALISSPVSKSRAI